jgi:kinesin family protein 22
MQGNHQEPGIIPRVAEFLFETKQATQISTIEITMSYMEILKETVYDMLTTKRKASSVG